MVDSKRLLQDMISEFGCTIINFIDNKIMVDFFYSEDMYINYLTGLDCKQGMAMYDLDQELVFNILPDGKLVIVQENGITTSRYRYNTISQTTITYKENKGGKKVNASLTFRIRENKYNDSLNFIDTKSNSIEYSSIDQIKGYLKHQYGVFKIIDGSEFF